MLDSNFKTPPPLNSPFSEELTVPLSNWRGSITTFNGFTGTKPLQELKDITWDAIKEVIASDSPAILEDKSRGKFFIPCLLKVAPFVGNTLDVAIKSGGPTTGKMRSKSHVTDAALLVIDIDGLSEAEFEIGLSIMQSSGLTFLAFTTHSQGREDKPGMRVRLTLPLDRSLDIKSYAAAWRGLDQHIWQGRAGKADSSGANLYQQQGTWCTHPDREIMAKCWGNLGGVTSADSLIAISGIESAREEKAVNWLCRPLKPETNHSDFSSDAYPTSDADKVANACNQIRKFRDNKGAHQSEPLWFDCLGIVGYCIDGDELSQDWSSGHNGYDERKTVAKLAYRLKIPPTTCAQLLKTNPSGCIGCSQKCRSPITLGWSDNFVAIVSSGEKT